MMSVHWHQYLDKFNVERDIRDDNHRMIGFWLDDADPY